MKRNKSAEIYMTFVSIYIICVRGMNRLNSRTVITPGLHCHFTTVCNEDFTPRKGYRYITKPLAVKYTDVKKPTICYRKIIELFQIRVLNRSTSTAGCNKDKAVGIAPRISLCIIVWLRMKWSDSLMTLIVPQIIPAVNHQVDFVSLLMSKSC